MMDIILTGLKIWSGALGFLVFLVFILHLLNKWDD